MTETEFPCGAYDSRTAKNENKQMPANNADVQMEHPGENSSDPALSSQSGYAAANPQKLHPSINKKDNVQMELSGVSGSNSVLSSPSGYAAAANGVRMSINSSNATGVKKLKLSFLTPVFIWVLRRWDRSYLIRFQHISDGGYLCAHGIR